MMKHAVFAAVLVALFCTSTPSFAVSEGCMLASGELDEFLIALPKACQADEDCAGFPLRMDPCADAVMLPKRIMADEEVMSELGTQLVKARSACMKDYPAKMVCKKRRYWLPACNDGVCVNNWHNRPDTLDMPKGGKSGDGSE